MLQNTDKGGKGMIPYLLQSSSAEAFAFGLSVMCCLAIIIAIAFVIFICVILWRASGRKKVEYHTTTVDKYGKDDRYCPNCGRSIPFDARVCPFCNKDFEAKNENNEVKIEEEQQNLVSRIEEERQIEKLKEQSGELAKSKKKGKSDRDFYCDACNRTIPDDANICPYCGEKFDNAEAKICKSCGVENTTDGKFCKECGEKL